jgi:hypothetical protein
MARRDDKLRQVRSLLDRAEGTDNEHERDACLARAQELMVRWAIDEGEIAERDEAREQIIARRLVLSTTKGYKSLKTTLFSVVARTTGCQAVLHHGYQTTSGTLVGFESDVAYAEMLFTSLLTQLFAEAETAWRRHRATLPWLESGDARVFKTSFGDAFNTRLHRRLAAMRQAAVERVDAERHVGAHGDRARAGARTAAGAHRSAELVLAERADQVQAEFERRFPNLKAGRGATRTRRSVAGYTAGDAAGLAARITGRGAPVGQRDAIPPRS